jgi:hypothetical protein
VAKPFKEFSAKEWNELGYKTFCNPLEIVDLSQALPDRSGYFGQQEFGFVLWHKKLQRFFKGHGSISGVEVYDITEELALVFNRDYLLTEKTKG